LSGSVGLLQNILSIETDDWGDNMLLGIKVLKIIERLRRYYAPGEALSKDTFCFKYRDSTSQVN